MFKVLLDTFRRYMFKVLLDTFRRYMFKVLLDIVKTSGVHLVT